MKTKIGPQLLDEAERYQFRFACEDCVHFVIEQPDRNQCAHGYPPAPKRDALAGAVVIFCKEFELR